MPCPDLHTIKAFLNGDDSLAQQHSRHIRHCLACQTQLDRLAEDPELRSWRDSLAAAHSNKQSDKQSDACRQLVERLRAKETQADPTHAHLATPVSEVDVLAFRTLASGSMVDHFRIVKEIGRGGMSVVMEAIDTRLNRPVALKLMLGPTIDSNARARFVREATTVSSIQHPNVVSVFDVEYDGSHGPYLAMELIQGDTLREWIASGNGFDIKETAQLIAQVADGLNAAHRAGVLHRDIKPSNILIAKRNNDEVGGTSSVVPKLADFGLALPMHVDDKLTRSGVLTGTPAYASPEQITVPESIDQRSDIYSLGVTLYESLTGTVPFHGSAQNVLKQIVEGEYVSPRSLNKEIPKDLETICLKAMSTTATHRYATAQMFAADLRHWLTGEPIIARPSSSFEKAWRWAMRNPRVAGLLTLVGTLLVMIACGSTYAAFTISAAQKDLKAESIKAQQANEAEAKSASIAMDQRKLALDSLNQLINGVQTQLAGRAGTLKLREELLRTAAQGLTRIADGADPTQLEQTTIDAHQQLAKIHSALGETTEAKSHLKQAIELCESALIVRPDEVNIKRNLADALSLEADFYRNEFATDKVEATLKRILELRQTVAASSSDLDSARRLIIVKQQLADLAWKRSELTVALPVFQECAEAAKNLHEQRPNEKQLIRDLYILHNRMAAVLSQQNKLKESEENFEISRGYCETLLKLDPDNQDYQLDSAYVLSRIARMKLSSRELSTARELAQRSVEKYEAVAAKDVDDVRSQSLVGSAHTLNCEIALALEDFEEARKSSQVNIDIQMRMAKQFPETPKYLLLASQSFGVLADIDVRQGHREAAVYELHTIVTALEGCLQSLDTTQRATVMQVLEYYKTLEAALSLLHSEHPLTTSQLEAQPKIARCASAYLLYEQARLEMFDRLSEAAAALEDLSMVSVEIRDFIEVLSARAYAIAFGKLSSRAMDVSADSLSSDALVFELKQKSIAMCRHMTKRNPQLQQWLFTEPDFIALRRDSEFQELLSE